MLFTPLLDSIRPKPNNHDYLLSSKHTTRYTMIMFLRILNIKTWTFFVNEIWVNFDVFDWEFCRPIYVTGCFLQVPSTSWKHGSATQVPPANQYLPKECVQPDLVLDLMELTKCLLIGQCPWALLFQVSHTSICTSQLNNASGRPKLWLIIVRNPSAVNPDHKYKLETPKVANASMWSV